MTEKPEQPPGLLEDLKIRDCLQRGHHAMMLSSTSSQYLYQNPSVKKCTFACLNQFHLSCVAKDELSTYLSSFCCGVDCTKAARFGLVGAKQLNSDCISCLVDVLFRWSCGMKTLKANVCRSLGVNCWSEGHLIPIDFI